MLAYHGAALSSKSCAFVFLRYRFGWFPQVALNFDR